MLDVASEGAAVALGVGTFEKEKVLVGGAGFEAAVAVVSPFTFGSSVTFSGFHPAFDSASRKYVLYCESSEGITVVRSVKGLPLIACDKEERKFVFNPRKDV